MADWYDNGLVELRKEACEAAEITEEQFIAVYGFLSEIGLIDYDIEKEILFERYGGEDEDA